MRWLTALLLTLGTDWASADDLLIFKRADGKCVVFKTADDGNEVLGVFGTVTVIEPSVPTPIDEPTGPGQLICVRPWSCTLDESDADLTIRESLDAAGSKVPYLRLLPGTLDQRMQPHAVERYRGLVADATKAWIFHIVPTKTTPRILHQGPLDADTVLKWVNVPKVAFAVDQKPNEDQWLDVDFSRKPAERLGAIELPPELARQALAAATDVTTLPGFTVIPKSEWSSWTERFPIARLVRSVRNTTDQTMGSCVGHSCANICEASIYSLAGDLFFRRLSGMSMYVRIGRSPNSGAYIGDAADEIFSNGILPVIGQGYSHEFQQDTNFGKLPTGWEATAAQWKARVYSVDGQEAAFRVLMDWREGTHFGRSNHALRGLCVTESGKWAYENSWGSGWGDFGKSIGYDSKFYSSYTYLSVLRDEVPVLLARELPVQRLGPPRSSAMEDAARRFHERIEEIRKAAEKKCESG